MLHGKSAKGGTLTVVSIVLVVVALAVGGFFIYKKSIPKPVPPGFDTTVLTVPPPNETAFDPKPLMDKLAERTTTDKFRFAVLGDSKHASTLPAFVKYLDETVNPDFVLTTGDMVSKGGGQPGPGFYQMLSKELGADMRKRPWWPAIGNHEVAGTPTTAGSKSEAGVMQSNQQTGIENFKRFYNLPDDHYTFNFRNCAFIVLPFRSPKNVKSEWTESDLAWLDGALKTAADAKKHIFVLNHQLFFTVGAKGADEVPNKENAATELFQKYHVKAVFSGHDHGYYRTLRSGVTYLVSAGGGATIYAGKRISEALPDDVYYYADAAATGTQDVKFVLHKGGGQPDKLTTTPDQFMCVVDVDGDKINCFTVTVKGEKWDELPLSK